ncbi:uncharacterized protein LOC110985171 isoform X2 [Acanthaster planci]|uniref:Uncharacterized protein LOC110985171 isoform X2 n=1 Tax=Acanthaster planci TaxID=133434 RepID=A0A8B7Z7R5_ACAPL|nr:uncharacterized protein LOC110985171 isoform X2 [Acanthaster planci]
MTRRAPNYFVSVQPATRKTGRDGVGTTNTMRLTSKLVRSRSRGPLYSVEYLDLSYHGIVTIDGLKQCSRLQALSLQGNNIAIVQNLESCYSLWRLDLSNCKISNLDGLSKFIALGCLNLANNDLKWGELMKIRHMHILDLSLHGNEILEKDEYCRIHVIDSLPNVWTLDGKIVTSAERIQVQQFFQDSALSKRPVRHKLTREQFVPTPLKKIEVNGIYGERTTHFMMRFPTNGSLNVETDHRRLKYLFYCLEQDLRLEMRHRKTDQRLKIYQTHFMESLLDVRPKERDRCNVLLLLLVASLEFVLPTYLVQETLSAAKLTDVGGVETIELFLMPRDHRCQVSSLLLSAVKVDRDNKKDGGLYDRLYLCLYHAVTELYKKMHANAGVGSPQTSPRSVVATSDIKEFKSLLAAEVVQLFCIVPVFFDYVTKESGVMRLVSVATADTTIVDKVADLIERIKQQGGELRRIIEEVAEFLINALNRNTKDVLNKGIPVKSLSTYVLSTPKALPRRPQSSPVHASKYLAIGRPSPDCPPTSARTRPATAQGLRVTGLRQPQQRRQPKLGDKVLLAPQNLGFIIALPECDIALVQMDSIPAPNGSVVTSTGDVDQNYCYIDMAEVTWDAQYQYWKPVGTIGDRITIQNIDELPPANPPASPRTGNTPPHSPREDPQLPPSPAGETEDLPRSVSVLLRERLRLTPQINVVDLNVPTPIPSQARDQPSQPKERGPVQSPVSMEPPEGVLYECVKCAMEVVKSNNEGVSPGTDAEKREQEVKKERTSRREEQPSSACSLSGLTERAIDDHILEDVSEANSQTASTTRRNSFESLGENLAQQADLGETAVKPKMATGQPRATSAKSVVSDVSVSSTRSHTIEVDLRPESEMLSEYQVTRTEEWKRTSVTRPQSSKSIGPASRSSTPTRGRYREPSGSPVLVQQGTDWLAGGLNVHRIERLTNKMKVHHTPGWMEGMTGRRPQSVGPNRSRTPPRQNNRRMIKSAGMSREGSSAYTVSHQPPPSPASTDLNFPLTDLEPDYLRQARQHNFHSKPVQRSMTPPYGGPHRPPSPLSMQIK